MTEYTQCKLAQGNKVTVGFIERRAARVGAKVEVKGEGWWVVLTVGDHWITAADLHDKQARDRDCLPSLEA